MDVHGLSIIAVPKERTISHGIILYEVRREGENLYKLSRRNEFMAMRQIGKFFDAEDVKTPCQRGHFVNNLILASSLFTALEKLSRKYRMLSIRQQAPGSDHREHTFVAYRASLG